MIIIFRNGVASESFAGKGFMKTAKATIRFHYLSPL